MVRRTAKGNDQEPEQKQFDLPSEKEHLFQVVDVYDSTNSPGNMDLDADTVCAKLEVVGGSEEGRTMLNRMTLDDNGKGFWATKLFLKAISEPYKGEEFPIDTDNWQARQFYATVVHNGKYANIKKFNFEKLIDQATPKSDLQQDTGHKEPEEEIQWDEDMK